MARKREIARDAAYNALVKEYRKLAKRADQRLVRLEGYAKQPKYEHILEFAYARAMRDIRSWSGENASRFNTKPPKKIQSLEAKISDIKTFLAAASSSIKPTTDNVRRNKEGQIIAGGIELTFQKRADTLNRKYGTNVTWETVGRLFESALYKKLEKTALTSETRVRIIGNLQRNEKAIVEQYEQHHAYKIVIENDKEKPLTEETNKVIRYRKKDVIALFGEL